MRWCELKPGQRELLDELLEQPPATHHRPLLCATINKTAIPSETSNGSAPLSNKASSDVGSAAQKYAPSGGSIPLSSGNNAQESQPAGNAPVQPVLGTQVMINTPITNAIGCNTRSWVIFGVNGGHTTPELDQIGDHHLTSDIMFLRKLRRKHREHRGWARTYLSCWRLNHWEFVKVS